MNYKRQYHLMEWLSDEYRTALGPDNLLLLRNAFIQYSDATSGNALPLDYIVSKICSYFEIPQPLPYEYLPDTLLYYDCVWKMTLLQLNW